MTPNSGTNIHLDEGQMGAKPHRRPVRPPHVGGPAWGPLLGWLPLAFPLVGLGLMNFTLLVLPALRAELLADAIPLPFASPVAPGFELACLVLLWAFVLGTRYWWFTVYGRWNPAREIAYWVRFAVGWFLATVLTNFLLSFTPTPEQIIVGVPYAFRHSWYLPAGLFPAFLIPGSPLGFLQEVGLLPQPEN